MSLPAATTTVTPLLTALATASSIAVLAPPPSDMLATAGLFVWAATQSDPAITPLLLPDPLQPSTRTGTKVVPLATP